MAATLTRKRCASVLLNEPVPAPPHLAKRGRFSPAPAAFAAQAHQQQAAASATTEAAALREENGALRARAEALERDNGVLRRWSAVAEQHRRQEALERDNGVLKHGVAALHLREEAAQRAAAESKAREGEAKREAAELRKKVAELEVANYALAARMLGADSCRFQAFRGPDVF